MYIYIYIYTYIGGHGRMQQLIVIFVYCRLPHLCSMGSCEDAGRRPVSCGQFS